MMDRAQKIKQMRAALEGGHLIGVSMRMAGIRSSDTLWRWQKEARHDRLRKMINIAVERGQQRRDEVIEDSFYEKLKRGNGSGKEYEFYLTNRRPDRWKKVNEFAPPPSAPVVRERPVINYISVHAENAKVTVGGNGNGKELSRTADHA